MLYNLLFFLNFVKTTSMSCDESIYIASAADLEQKITRLQTIIDALELRMVEVGAGNATTEEYQIDDGQVRINTIYRNPESIAKAILLYERLKQKAINQYNGRGYVLRNWRGLV